MIRTTRHAALAIVLTAGLASVAHAECGGVIIDPEQGYAFVSDPAQEWVHAATRWDPDGDGPEPAWLVVAGQFRRAATQISQSVVAWDGKQWHALDAGLPTPGVSSPISIVDIENYNGTLVAYTAMGSTPSNVLKWNGSSWEQLGEAAVYGASSRASLDMEVHNGELYVAGAIGYIPVPPTGLGATPALRLVGETWQTIGPRLYGGTSRMTRLESAPEGLYGAGNFTGVGTTPQTQVVLNNVGLWNGTQWLPLGEGLNGPVRDTAYLNGQLYVVGTFTQSGATLLPGIARWDGTQWHAVSDGTQGTTLAIEAHNDAIFITTSDASDTRLLRLNGETWTEVARPGQAPAGVFGGAAISGLVSDPDGLLVLGRFSAVSEFQVGGAAVIKGDGAIHSLGAGFAYETKMVNLNGQLITRTNRRAGDEPVNRFAQWDGHEWKQAAFPFVSSWTLASAGERLLATDLNLTTHTLTVKELHDGVWTDIGDFVYASNVNNVQSFVDYAGDLYASGPFVSVAGAPIKGLARWDGAHWTQVGSGLDWTGTTYAAHTLAIVDGNLYIAGSFDRVGGELANGLARWDGITLTPLYDPDIIRPYEIANWNGDLIGLVRVNTQAGSSYVVSRLDDASWSTIAAVPPGNSPGGGFLTRLLPVGDSLWALYWQYPNTSYIIKLNSENTWEQVSGTIVLDLPLGFESRPFYTDALVFNNEIHVFGEFSREGDNIAIRWARYSTNGVPLIVTQPDDVITSCGSPVELRATIASGYDADGPLEYQWYLNGNALSETQFTRGVNTDTLTIPALAQPFTGIYTLAVTNSCGTATSREVFVSGDAPDCRACSPCAADFDFDGGVTGDDVAAFFTAYETNAPCADVDSSGGVDGSDLAHFFTLFEAGGC